MGPAGLGGYSEAFENLETLKANGLNACEIAFTYSVYLNNKQSDEIGKKAKEMGVSLSIHAPYYINLNSAEKAKINASIKRILDCCERGHHLGASKVVFHPGYFGKSSKEECYSNVKEAILTMRDKIKSEKWKIQLAPETTGKINVFGTEDEIIHLVDDTGCSFCIDFAHIWARNKGEIDYVEVFGKLKKFKELHCHYSGITFGEKGEKAHKLTESLWAKNLANAILKSGKDVTLINESPDPFGDSLKMKKLVEELRK